MRRMALTNLVVLLITAATASATTTVTLVPIEEGEPGSATNPLDPSEEVLVYVISDGGLLGLDAVLTVVDGPATITGAMGDPNWIILPGIWPPEGVFPPIIDPDGKRAEICAGSFGVTPSGVVGWFLLHCDGPGVVTVELTGGIACGGSLDENFMVPNISGTLEIHQASEPTCWDDTECPCQKYGDATCDGGLNLADLFALKSTFGRCAPWTGDQCCADFTHDGCVNLADLYILRGWHICFDPPGPSTGNQNCPP
jgi:hypothetical protein